MDLYIDQSPNSCINPYYLNLSSKDKENWPIVIAHELGHKKMGHFEGTIENRIIAHINPIVKLRQELEAWGWAIKKNPSITSKQIEPYIETYLTGVREISGEKKYQECLDMYEVWFNKTFGDRDETLL